MFFKIGVLKDFTNYTRKRLCWSLIFKKLQAEGSRSQILFKIDVKF